MNVPSIASAAVGSAEVALSSDYGVCPQLRFSLPIELCYEEQRHDTTNAVPPFNAHRCEVALPVFCEADGRRFTCVCVLAIVSIKTGYFAVGHLEELA
jgi:hypothetical protein